MQRVLVVGSGGAGKTTFSLALAKRTGLPVVHLDAHFWRWGWVQPESEVWADQVDRLTAEPRWIMDGNYGGTMAARLAVCDTAIFLDRPRLLCIWRVIKRRAQHHGVSRPDLAPGCPEQLSVAFLRYIWNYPSQRRPIILSRLDGLRADQSGIMLRTDAEIQGFLKSAEEVPPPTDSPQRSRAPRG